MATFTPVAIFEGVMLPNAAAVSPGLFASPANTRTKITAFNVVNTDTVARVLSVHIVASGGTATATNLVAKTEPIGPGAAYPVYQAIGQVLEAGDFITAFGDASGVLAARASGLKVV